MDVTSGTRTNADSNAAKEAPIEWKESSNTVEEVIGHENQPTRTNLVVRWYVYGHQDDTVDRAEHIPLQLRDAY